MGIGRLVPELTSTRPWLYEVIGVCFAGVGVMFVWIGHRRAREVEQALDRGEFVPFSGGLSLVLALAGTVLGIATIGVILATR